MFVLRDQYTCEATVKVMADGHEIGEFVATFKVLSMDRMRELDGNQLMREVWVGWSGVVADGGKEVAFSEAERDRLLGLPVIMKAVGEAYTRAMGGRLEKN